MAVSPRRLLTLAVAIGLAIALLPQAGDAAARWRNHDNDNWSGWFQTSDPAALASDPAGCDPIDPAQCMLPYPNDWFTQPDPTSRT